MSELTYHITTLGCRVNHAEAREIESILRLRGLSPAGPDRPADLQVVHTCTVTNTAAAKSRAAIRRALRQRQVAVDLNESAHENPHTIGMPTPEIVVTGCYAGSDTDQVASIVGASERVITQADPEDRQTTMIARFTDRIDRWLDRNTSRATIRNRPAHSSQRAETPVVKLPIVKPEENSGRHLRAELRVQDGCDAHCTFCIIPKIRPTLRSKTIPDAVAEATRLVELGHPEIVLAGIFIGAYGHETALRRRQHNPHASHLADLIDAVAQVPGLIRLRLSSMEPVDASEPLLDAMVANRPVVVPHLHLPLQSGSDRVLRRMNRQYRVANYLEMIDRVNAALTIDGLPPAITTDIICGFPGETIDEFEETVAIARRVGYLHMHVFPYSDKRGTAAARWTDQFVSTPERQRRVRKLIDLEKQPEEGLSIRYRRRLLGRTVRVLLEQADPDRPGWMLGRCDHYARVAVRTERVRGTALEVVIDEVDADGTRGRGSVKNSLPVLGMSDCESA